MKKWIAGFILLLSLSALGATHPIAWWMTWDDVARVLTFTEDIAAPSVTVGASYRNRGAGTVAQIPSTDLQAGDVFLVTDGATPGDFVTGEGDPAYISMIYYNGSAWVLASSSASASALGDNAPQIFGDDSDFKFVYNSTSGLFELRNAADDVLGWFDTDGTYTVNSAGNQGIIVDSTPDTDLKGSGFLISETVDTNAVGVGACLAMAADFHLDEADASPVASGGTDECLWIAAETGTGSKQVWSLAYGAILRNDAWNWNSGWVYLSETQGTLTQTPPSTSGALLQRVGWAKSADVVHFFYSGSGRHE